MKKQAKQAQKTVVLISYNKIHGFQSGWHGGKRIYICANDAGRGHETGEGRSDQDKANGVMHKISGRYYHGAVPVENVERYYIYAGLYAFSQAIDLAKSIFDKNGKPTTVVACSCDKMKKESLLAGTGITLAMCECGGESSLGRIVEKILEAS